MKSDFLRYLSFLSATSSVIPFLVAVASFRFLRKENVFLLAFCMLQLGAELFYSALFYLKLPNKHVAYIYLPLEVTLFILAVNKLTHAPARFLYAALVVIFFAVCYELSSAAGNSFALRAVCSISLIITAMYGLYSLLVVPDVNGLQGNALFWLCCCLLLYNAGNLVLFVFESVVVKEYTTIQYSLWIIHAVLNILFNCLLVIPILCLKKNTPFGWR